MFMRHTLLMSVSPSLYCRHRFPAEIIGQCVWLYFRFTLSHRDIEEMMAVRGVTHAYKGTGKSAPPAKGGDLMRVAASKAVGLIYVDL